MQLAGRYVILNTSIVQGLCVAACFIVTGKVTPLRFRSLFDKEWRVAFWAFLGHRLIPRNEITLRIVATAIKDFPAFTASLTDIAFTASFWAIDADVDRLCISALRIPCTREEFRPYTTGFDHHWTATLIACFIGGFLFSGRCRVFG